MNIIELKEILMNVPVDVIRFFAEKNELLVNGQNKDEMVESLVHSASKSDKLQELESIASEYRFAGRTAIDWYVCLEPNIMQLGEVEERIVERFSTDAFTYGRLRPPLSKDPKLIFANIDRDRNQILLMFAYNGPMRRILVNYEPRVDYPTFFDYAVLKFNPFTIEVRANFNMSKRIKNVILSILGLKEDIFKRLEIIGDDNTEKLRQRLDAYVQLARHQGIIGDYDWIEVLADAESGDLSNSEHYQREIAIAPSKRKILTFDHTYSFGLTERVTLEINTEEGRIWFRSAVGEEVIQRVLEQVLAISKEGGRK